MRITTGDNYGIVFSRNLPATTSGVFSIDFNPTQKFPFGGIVYVRLLQDSMNYYELYNTDGYNEPGYLIKVASGVEVERVLFPVGYTQGQNYKIKFTFSPGTTIVEAFGSISRIQTNQSAIAVGAFAVDVSQQDSYFDNISFTSGASSSKMRKVSRNKSD